MTVVDPKTGRKYVLDLVTTYRAAWIAKEKDAEGNIPIVVYSDGALDYTEVRS